VSLRVRTVAELPAKIRGQVAERLSTSTPAPPSRSAEELRRQHLREERERHVQGLLTQLRYVHLEELFEREFRFHPSREWRLDLYSRAYHLGIELHGATSEFKRGRHLRGGPGGGFERDRLKMNAAIECGIRVLEYCCPMAIADGTALAQIERIVGAAA